MIEFKKVLKYARILSPLKNFEEETLTFEYREDPLTGRNTTVISGMLNYVGKFLTSDWELIGSIAERTRAACPFCPENVKTRTPMFPADFIPEGRILIDDTVIIPNLLGHAEQSVLAILSREHYLKLEEFKPKMFFNAFKGGLDYLKRLRQRAPSVRFPVFAINYLPPAGSSILHPHMQILARDRPFYLVGLYLEKGREFYERHGSSYWQSLAAVERESVRHLFMINGVEWFVPFAPLRGLNEVQAIVPGKSNLLELAEDELIGLAEGLTRILRFYGREGYASFNAVLMSGPMDEHLEYFDVNLIVVSRPGVQPMGFTDAWTVSYILWDGEAVEEPEVFAGRVKAILEGDKLA